MRGSPTKIANQSFGTAESVAVDILAEARRLAQKHNRDTWDFAVELSVLLAAGVTVNLLRSLVCQGAGLSRAGTGCVDRAQTAFPTFAQFGISTRNLFHSRRPRYPGTEHRALSTST